MVRVELHRETAPVILPAPRPGRWVGLGVVVAAGCWIAYQVLTNPGFEWAIVGRYMLNPQVLRGVGTTIELTILVMLMGTAIGVGLALMRMGGGQVLPFCAYAFTWFFRGTPVLVQLVFWYNLAALFPMLSLGMPFGGPKLSRCRARRRSPPSPRRC